MRWCAIRLVFCALSLRLYDRDNRETNHLRQEIASLFTGLTKKPSPKQEPVDPLISKPLVFSDNGLPMTGNRALPKARHRGGRQRTGGPCRQAPG